VGVSAFFAGERRWLSPPAYLKDWALMDVEPILADALGVPVTVENDGNVAAIAESLFGVGQRCGHFVYLHLTNGFGGGIIADGKLFRGFHGNAGEFGGVWALCADAYPNLELLRTCLAKRGNRFDSVEEMTQRIDASWDGVELWLERAVPPFRLLSDILGYCIDPQMIVIGGRLPKSIARRLIERIDFPRRHHGDTQPPPAPIMAVAEAPGEPVALGAAVLPLQQAFFL
jgi:predicted NBD/HSP70 family sugar kinase